MIELLKKYKDMKKESNMYFYADYIMQFDSTTDCPINGRKRSYEVQNYFYSKALDILLSDEYKNTVTELYKIKDSLEEVDKLDIEIEYKGLMKTSLIPKEELLKHEENVSNCYQAWEKGRVILDFSEFEKELKELVIYNKKLCKWWEKDNIKGYDVLLDDMEDGYNQKMYDEFFLKIEKDLLPFVKKVINIEPNYNKKLDTLKFDISKQKELTELILEKMGYTKDRGCIRETVHPYTNWADNNDVRISTRYHEDLLFSNLYSVMHETGHALFQLQMDDKYNDTNVFNNVTCITHESQSRFYENYLGRRYSFVKFLYPHLKELFPKEFEDITLDDVYNYVNTAKAGFTRTEADELTYPLHVLIRYNVEKKLFNGEIEVEDIEETFNKYMFEYLGIKPENKLIGCYQDSHWTSGFGYFPTYAVGSAYGAMFLDEMMKDIDIDKELEKGDFTLINKWLKEKIHKYSGTRKNLEVVKAVTDKDFDPDRYISYLKDKFSKLYKI